MCNLISNRLVIGNYLIESIEKNKYTFTLDEFDRFEKELTIKLNRIDYYSTFDEEGIFDFIEDYPSFLKFDSDTLTISNEMDKERFLKLLKRYFRVGISKSISSAISETSRVAIVSNV